MKDTLAEKGNNVFLQERAPLTGAAADKSGQHITNILNKDPGLFKN